MTLVTSPADVHHNEAKKSLDTRGISRAALAEIGILIRLSDVLCSVVGYRKIHTECSTRGQFTFKRDLSV